ncbi:MAG TPA: hypothetical protein VGM02_09115 [Acidobacteriaceae bacterium]
MRQRRSFATTSLIGAVLALTIATAAAPSLSPIGRDLARSYHSAAQMYERARMWSVIARWWIDPEYDPSSQDGQHDRKVEDVCQMAPAGR